MSTKEMLLHEIDAMNEKQLQGLLLFIQESPTKKPVLFWTI